MHNKTTILLVEDDHDIRDIASLRLRGAGYHTMSASDGDEGVRRAVTEQPDAIVMDVRMPHKDGMTALSELKAGSTTRNIPIVMLSASIVDQHRALEAGASFFLAKPYKGNDLLATVSAAINKKPLD